MTDPAAFEIDEKDSIAEAFRRLNLNGAGILVVVDGQRRAVGVATDGDIRRHLLRNPDTAQQICRCMNADFVRVSVDTPREAVLKRLDSRVRAIPALDGEGRLVRLVTRESLRPDAESSIFSRARAPVRISFGGGVTDLTPLFTRFDGVVINAAIQLYGHAALRRRADRRVRLASLDYGIELEAESVKALSFDGRLDLVKAVISLIEPDFGFELELGCDVPPDSGLGGSAVVAATVIGCFNQFREDRWDRHQLAELAFQAERLVLRIPGGWQDQYATVFGGFNFMEFTADHNTIYPLRLEPETVRELEASLLLCRIGERGDARALQQKTLDATQGEAAARFAEATQTLTLEMKRQLLRGRVADYGRLLDRSWQLKREFLPHTTSPGIDRFYELAKEAGAIGGRLLGAGAGGYFLLQAAPFRRFRLAQALRAEGLEVKSFTFDSQGLQSWAVRESEGPA